MIIHPSSRGLEPTSLEPGLDLVLEAAPEHGADLPPGTAVGDYLDIEARRVVDREAMAAIRSWRRATDPLLTANGICLPLIWQLELYTAATRILTVAAGTSAAIEAHAARSLEVRGGDQAVAEIGRAVAHAAAIELTEVGSEPGPSRSRTTGSPTPPAQARRAFLGSVRRLGIPSRLRPGSVAIVSYWPLEPVIDRMVKEGGARPAVVVDKLPSGPRRSLRAAIRGGWIGTPGPRDRRAGAAEARVAIEAARSAPEIEACGLGIGPAIHEMAIALARRRAAADLARARMLRRLFARRRPAAILSAWDSEPTARLVIHLAKEAGIRTFVLSHGAYLLSTVARDMDFGDEILTWSDAMEFPKPPAGTPTHVVGYPAAPGPIPPTRRFGGDPAAARIMVLSQPATVSLIDSRAEMDGYLTAIDAIAGQAPGATIVLRPHPASGRASAEAAARRYPHSQVAIDTETHIGELLAGCDLCVGAATAATLQAALVGTPVIALNLTGFDWEWPLGHGGSVPVVASRSELEDWLARWLAGEELPGRSEMLAALGVNGSDSTGRIIDLVTGRAS